MYKALSPGAVGVKVDGMLDAIKLARESGFDGVEVGIADVADLIDNQGREKVRAYFSEAGIRPAGWGMPIDFRGDESAWIKGLEELPRLAAAASDIDCRRTMTWIMPCSDVRPFEENRKFYIDRFRPISEILLDHGCTFGLEFIGPKTLWTSQKYPFIHTMKAMLEMCEEIGPNMGLLLDCWHWHTSGGTVEQIEALRPEQVVYVHVNDAPPGVSLDQYVDNQRAMPGATGVIDIAGFLGALRTIGYDGPVTPEPFGNGATWARQSLDSIWKTAGL